MRTAGSSPREACTGHERTRQPSAFFIDLAVPRDADPAINDMEGVFLHDVDSLQQIAAESLVIRQREVERCESLIESHVGGFMNWLQSLHNPEWQR